MEGRKTGQKWERQMEERKTGQKWESRFPSPQIELPCKSAAASRRASRRAIAAGDPPAPSLKECRQREARFSLSFPKIGLPCKSAAASASRRAIAAGDPSAPSLKKGRPDSLQLLARECREREARFSLSFPKIGLPCKSAAASASRRAIAAGDPSAPSLQLLARECRKREARFSLSFPKLGLPCKSAAASAAHRAIAAGEPFGKPSPLLARECQQLADPWLQTGQPLVPFSRGGPVACPLPLLERPFCCFPAPPGPLAKACAPLRCGRRPSRSARRRWRWRLARSKKRAWKRPPDGQGGCMGAEFASSRRLRWPRPPAVALPRSLPARRRFRSRGRPLLNPRSRLRDLGRLWVQRVTIFAGFKLSTRKRGPVENKNG